MPPTNTPAAADWFPPQLSAPPWGAAILAAILGAALLAGCGPQSPTGSPDAAPQPQKAVQWFAYYLQGSKVGYGKTEIEKTADKVVIRSENELTIVRFGAPTTQRLIFQTETDAEGRLRSFQSRVESGPTPMVASGQVTGDKLVMKTGGQRKEIPWRDEYGGYFAVERSLDQSPMKPGEERTIACLQQVLNQVADVKLKAHDYETVATLGEPQRLLKITASVTLGGNFIESHYWTNEEGELIKSRVPGVDQVGYRTTEKLAKSPNVGKPLDLGYSTVVSTRQLRNAHQTRRIVYRAVIKEGDPAKTFPSGVSQRVKKIDNHTAEIEVVAVRPNVPQQAPKGDAPTDADRQAGPLIQSDDEQVIALAQSVAKNETDPWTIATALEAKVHDYVRSKNFSTALASAADVVRTREGDCTEHGMLLAALCRARGIPSRVAVGLVYYPDGRGFAYHMWTECWIADRWIPLDATLGRGGIGAAHLKLANTHLKDDNAMTAFLPVLQVLGQLKLEIVSVE